jgi:putative ABC transport system permease protein
LNSYTLHITLYDLFFFGMIFIGLNFALLLALVKSGNRIANRFLALALGTMILWMMRILAIDIRLEIYLPGWDRLPMQFLLALGPFIYFYVLKITRPDYKFSWKDLLHFSPVLLELGALALETNQSIKTALPTYATPIFQQLNPILQLLIFISITTYLYRSHKLINNFYRRLQPVLMDRSRLEFRWLRHLLTATALLWLLWIAYAVVDYFGYRDQLGIHVYYPFYIFFAVIIIWIAMATFLRPQAGMMVQPGGAPKPSAPAELREKGAWLKKAMDANLYYQDPELSVSSLAKKLGLNSRELSRIINITFRKSFNDFINEYRVRDVARKMQDPAFDRITLLGIAWEAGFNSKSTFNRIFKQMTGKSPVEYKLALKKEFPYRDLRRHLKFAPVVLIHETPPAWGSEKSKHNYMFRNYLKIAWRTLWLHKRMTSINIAGLGIGMAAAILIAIWVQNELSYDSNQPDAEHIYRVTSVWPQSPTETWRLNSSQYVLANVAVKEIPEIADVTLMRAKDYANTNFHIGQKIIQERKVTRVDDHWFKIFHYDFVDGSPAAFNKNLYSLILTQSAAKKFFGNVEAVGKLVRIDKATYQVEGVVKDNTANTSFDYDVFIPMAAFLTDPEELKQSTDWSISNYNTFFKLKPGANIKKVAAELTAIEHRNYKDATLKDKNSYDLINIRDMHFEEGLLNYAFKHGSRTITNVFIALAALLLLTACINYVNLTTARASARSKEVSVRKIVGAGRLQLFGQFMSESFLVSLIAVALSFALVQLCMPWFKEFTGKNFSEPIFSSLAWQIVGVTLIVSFILNGLYPALLLSSFRPLQVFRGKTMLNFKDTGLRKALVVVQFTISVVLIVGTLVIYRQLKYVENTDLGYDRSQVFMVDIPYSAFGNDYEKNAPPMLAAIKQELKQNSAIADISLANLFVDDNNKSSHAFDWAGRPKDFNPTFTPFSADPDFQQVMKLKMADGRWFSNSARDKHNVVLNETAARLINLHKPYIGQRFVHQGDTGTVIGVVKDFHYASLHDKIAPMIIKNDNFWFSAYIKTAPGNNQGAIAAAQKVMQKFAPDEPFEYHFVDDDYNKLYQAEQQSSVLIGLFAGIAILVSALGLTGLAAFAAEQKVKEIGIRKVLGASVQHIVALLSADFVKMVVIASFIAFPVAYWAMNKWLRGFAYKINLSWWIFAVSGATAMIIALITISYQSIKAALSNPVKSLRSE